jgi:predicted ATPase
VFEGKFPEVVRARPEILGHHCTEGGLFEEAISYWRRAGEMAIRRSAHTAAVGHFKISIEMLNKLPETSRSAQLELDLQSLLGNTLMTTKGYTSPEVKEALDRCRELCQQVGDTSQLFSVLHGLWIFNAGSEDSQLSHELAKQCLDLAKRLQDPALIMEAHHAHGSTYLWCGEYTSALSHFEQGIELYDSNSSSSQVLPPGRENPGVVHKSHCAHTLWLLGYPDQALDMIGTALDLARELNHPFSMVFAQFSDALVRLFRGEYDLAIDQARIAVKTSEDQGFVLWIAWASTYLGSALVAVGLEKEGINCILQALDICQKSDLKIMKHYDIMLSEAYCRVGKIKEGLEIIENIQPFFEKKLWWKFFESELYRIKGELLLKRESPDLKGAETEFKKALEIACKKQAKSLELRAAISMSRLLIKQGKEREAHKLLSEVYGWFTEGFDTADLKEAKALLDDLS